jgi:hypothetical protein
MHNSRYTQSPSYDDFGIIRNWGNTPFWKPGGYVYVHPGPDTTGDSTYDIYGYGVSSIGSRVCVTGGRSGTDCAAVKAPGWPVSGGYAVVDYCTTGGDSGAPVYSTHVAKGIHHGAMLGASACHDRLFQGIVEAAQELNVYVVTA